MFRENQELEMGMSRGARHPEAPMSGKGRQGDGESLNLSSEDRHPKTARSDLGSFAHQASVSHWDGPGSLRSPPA